MGLIDIIRQEGDVIRLASRIKEPSIKWDQQTLKLDCTFVQTDNSSHFSLFRFLRIQDGIYEKEN